MCDKCREIVAEIPNGLTDAMEAHRAELLAVLVKMTNMANPTVESKCGLTDERAGLLFGPLLVGFLLGEAENCMPEFHLPNSIDLLRQGMAFGYATTHATAVN